MYLGDFSSGSTVFFSFTTVNSSGAPTALSSAGVTAYRDGSTVQNATGITLTSSFDTITGYNRVQIDMVATSTFYQPGGQFVAIVSSGAASEDLSGYVLAHWSIKRGIPTDWASIYNSTTAVTLTGTSISTAQAIASVAMLSSTAEVNAVMIAGSTAAAVTLREHVSAQTTGIISAGSSTTLLNTDLSEVSPEHYTGLVVKFTSGALAGQGSDITAYSSTGLLTVTALTEAPSTDDAFVIA